MRTVLFYVHFDLLQGSALKVWDYFGHVMAAQGYTPGVVFTADSRWDATNPWFDVPDHVVSDVNSVRADVFFMGGRHWALAETHPDWKADAPVISLVQGIKHGDSGDDRFQYLRRHAVRICVSPEVESAISETGAVSGPILTIPNCIDLSLCKPAPHDLRQRDVLIVALKRPDLGAALFDRLQRESVDVRLLDKHMPRARFLETLRSARVAVFLPMEREGFYLPALEGLASETLVVCPDCIGNRSFCRPGINAMVPAFNEEALVEAALSALRLSQADADRFKAEGRRTAALHSLEVERQAFHDVLKNLDALWATAHRDGGMPTRSDATA